jgi:integrase/recombinase XerD
MEYMTKDELGRVFRIAKEENESHWQMILTGFYFGLRVSEVTAILGEDVQDNQLTVKRLKNSLRTLQRIPVTNGNPEFELRLTALAKAAGRRERIFPLSRQRCDQFMKRYCRLAGIHRSKAHFHSLKHSIAMAIWAETKQPGQVKSYLGHKSMSSTMQYLNESDSLKAQEVVSGLNY